MTMKIPNHGGAASVLALGLLLTASLSGAAPPGAGVFAYPKAGQSQEQQSKDQYDCHQWSVQQSGFDPASGGAAIHLSNNIVASIEPSVSGFIFGSCAGLGFLTEDERYSAQMYCTFTETGNDGFDVKASMDGEQGSVAIVGGSGKWQGATGSGAVKRKYAEGDRGSYEYEFKITTP